MKQEIDARIRAKLAGDPVETRCLGAATEAIYKSGCRCVDCRAVVAEARRDRRKRAVAEGRDLLPRIREYVRRFPIDGADVDDGMQVGLLAIEEARAHYNVTLGVPFEAFAWDVARRRLYDARVAASREKHLILTQAVRVVGVDPDDEPEPVLELLPSRAPDPYDVVVHRLELRAIIDALPRLTENERIALAWVLNGESYKGSRVVDNAIQRARRKLRAVAAAA